MSDSDEIQTELPGIPKRDIRLSDSQGAAVNKIERWLAKPFHESPCFRLFGFAGTGKTTLLKYGLAQWGREIGGGTIAATFTGKAALVMTRSGVPAQTIFSLIYLPTSATEEEVKNRKAELEMLRLAFASEKNMELKRKVQIELALAEKRFRDMQELGKIINEESKLRDADLLILDEVSMVDEEMATDLLSFEKKILVLGDPGQLPPVRGEGAFTAQEPDVMLTEIHRQALENPIIRLSMMAREGKHIPHGVYSDTVMKLSKWKIDVRDFIHADQVITGMNKTRLNLNNIMLRASGFTGPFPTGQGEKIICLKNDKKVGVINGQFLKLSKLEPVEEGRNGCPIMRAQITTEDGNDCGVHTLYLGHYQDHVKFDKERDLRDRFVKRSWVESTWGYAMTVHKSQGSGWGNVIFYDDGMGRDQENRNRLVYTAITRAENGLLILE